LKEPREGPTLERYWDGLGALQGDWVEFLMVLDEVEAFGEYG
jgi:hypothetical protein